MATSPLQALRQMTRCIAGRFTRTLERALGAWVCPVTVVGIASPATVAAAADGPSELLASPQALWGATQ